MISEVRYYLNVLSIGENTHALTATYDVANAEDMDEGCSSVAGRSSWLAIMIVGFALIRRRMFN